jgi:hypothetical protein
MFFRVKTSGPRSYLQVVENRWEAGRPRQRVIATLGRLDQLQQSGQLDALLVSGARLAQNVLLPWRIRYSHIIRPQHNEHTGVGSSYRRVVVTAAD